MGQSGVLGVDAVGLAFLRADDAAEADAFRALVEQDFDGVALENGDDRAGEVAAKEKLAASTAPKTLADPYNDGILKGARKEGAAAEWV